MSFQKGHCSSQSFGSHSRRELEFFQSMLQDTNKYENAELDT